MDDKTAETVWEVGVFDAHCHPTDIMASVEHICHMKARVLTVMATRSQDQNLVALAADKYPLKAKRDISADGSSYVVPAFGWHPWFSYQLFDDRELGIEIDAHEHYRRVLNPSPGDEDFLGSLPTPRPISEFIEETEVRLQAHPLALVGEIGLDRSFRLPVQPSEILEDSSPTATGEPEQEHTPGSREGRRLTPYRVSMDHQRMVLKTQLELAAKHRRPVSIHSVQAHGVVFDLFQELWSGHERPSKRQQKRKRSVSEAHNVEEDSDDPELSASFDRPSPALPFPQRICMHSYSGPVDNLKQFLNSTVPADIFFSFSQVINFSSPSSEKVTEVIRALPDSQILIESDLHCAGERMDGLLLDVIHTVCEIKQWELLEGVKTLKRNWERFIFGA